jgi:hypothetical protein
MIHEPLQSVDEGSPPCPDEGDCAHSPSSGCCRAIEAYCAGLRLLTRAVLWWIAQGAFCLYAYFGIGHLTAPYIGIASGIALRDPLVATASLLTIVVFYPYLEILVVLPLGIFKEMANFRALWRLSPLHWALKGLDWAALHLQERPVLAFYIVSFVTVAVAALAIVIFVCIASAVTWWSAITALVFVLPPVLFALWNLVRLVALSWLCFLRPARMEDQAELESDDEESWPHAVLWVSYALDKVAGPLFCRGPNFAVHAIMTALFLVLAVLNIVVMVRHFNWIYLLSTMVIVACFPFLIRFHVLKIFGRFASDRHPRFLKIAKILFGIHIALFVIFLGSTAGALTPPPKYAAHDFTSSGDIPIINRSMEMEMPSVCGTSFEGLSIFQLAGIAETPYDSVFGEQSIAAKMRLMLGRDWNQSFEILKTVKTDFSVFGHIKWHAQNLDLIVVTGGNSISDSLLSFAIGFLYHFPEEIFMVIPFAKGFYSGLLNILTVAFNIPADLYNPRRLTSAYIDPVMEYVESILTPEKKILLVGSSAGGGVAKIIGMHHGLKAIAYNSPAMKLWFIGDLSKKSVNLNFAHNILIPGQTYTGSETGETVEYIPFDDFPMVPASSSATICTLGIQCRVYEHVSDFCEKYVPEEVLAKIQELSPYR